jgi:hypothetical protein
MRTLGKKIAELESAARLHRPIVGRPSRAGGKSALDHRPAPARSLIGRHGLGGDHLGGQEPLAVGHAGLEVQIELYDFPRSTGRRQLALNLNETLIFHVAADL